MKMKVVLTMTTRPLIGAVTHQPTAKGHHMGAGRKGIPDLLAVLNPVHQVVEIPGPASKLAGKACYISRAARPPTAATVRKRSTSLGWITASMTPSRGLLQQTSIRARNRRDLSKHH